MCVCIKTQIDDYLNILTSYQLKNDKKWINNVLLIYLKYVNELSCLRLAHTIPISIVYLCNFGAKTTSAYDTLFLWLVIKITSLN